jgi:hypothetical protein
VGAWIFTVLVVGVSVYLVFLAGSGEYLDEKRRAQPSHTDSAGASITGPESPLTSEEEGEERRAATRWGLVVVGMVLAVTLGVPLLTALLGLEWVWALPPLVLLGPIALLVVIVFLVFGNPNGLGQERDPEERVE